VSVDGGDSLREKERVSSRQKDVTIRREQSIDKALRPGDSPPLSETEVRLMRRDDSQVDYVVVKDERPRANQEELARVAEAGVAREIAE